MRREMIQNIYQINDIDSEATLKAKAFDIIVKKRVNVNLLFECVEQYNYETVTLGPGADYYKLLTHEEYYLIKKALELVEK